MSSVMDTLHVLCYGTSLVLRPWRRLPKAGLSCRRRGNPETERERERESVVSRLPSFDTKAQRYNSPVVHQGMSDDALMSPSKKNS